MTENVPLLLNHVQLMHHIIHQEFRQGAQVATSTRLLGHVKLMEEHVKLTEALNVHVQVCICGVPPPETAVTSDRQRQEAQLDTHTHTHTPLAVPAGLPRGCIHIMCVPQRASKPGDTRLSAVALDKARCNCSCTIGAAATDSSDVADTELVDYIAGCARAPGSGC
jgi:hypothetical protein